MPLRDFFLMGNMTKLLQQIQPPGSFSLLKVPKRKNLLLCQAYFSNKKIFQSKVLSTVNKTIIKRRHHDTIQF